MAREVEEPLHEGTQMVIALAIGAPDDRERNTLCEKAANAYRQGNYRVIAGSSLQKVAFKVLERYARKLARTVLRGVGAGNSPRLPD